MCSMRLGVMLLDVPEVISIKESLFYQYLCLQGEFLFNDDEFLLETVVHVEDV